MKISISSVAEDWDNTDPQFLIWNPGSHLYLQIQSCLNFITECSAISPSMVWGRTQNQTAIFPTMQCICAHTKRINKGHKYPQFIQVRFCHKRSLCHTWGSGDRGLLFRVFKIWNYQLGIVELCIYAWRMLFTVLKRWLLLLWLLLLLLENFIREFFLVPGNLSILTSFSQNPMRNITLFPHLQTISLWNREFRQLYSYPPKWLSFELWESDLNTHVLNYSL